MARVELSDTFLSATAVGQHGTGFKVEFEQSGAAQPVYSGATGPGIFYSARTIDGTIEGYVEEGVYDLVVTAPGGAVTSTSFTAVNPTPPSGGSGVQANTQTASYTAALSDADKSVEMNSASATTFTVPPNSAVAFPVGTVIEVARIGAGAVTIAQGAGVVLRNRLEAAGTTNRTIAAQWSAASLRKRATDEWVLVGDIA